jgi:heme-degrading monooxygenase HmoA
MAVVRIWRGATRREDADRYVDVLRATGIADYLATPGNLGVEVLRRDEGDRAVFTILSTWTSLDAIRAFAGEDVEAARFYDEDEAFLIERDLRAEHHELVERRRPDG